MRLYNTPAWQKIRRIVLQRDGYKCKKCGIAITGKFKAHIDHIIPRAKRPDLAFDINNLQSLCQSCHNQIKQLEEKNTDPPAGLDGLPTDPNHPWNQQ